MNTNEKQLISDKMRSMPVGKLLFTMSAPAILSMFVQSLYNIVDSIYVGRITDLNNNAFDAISIATPLCMIVMALGIGIGVGVNVYISRKLGEKQYEQANNAGKTAVLMVLACWVVMVAFGLTISQPFVEMFTDNPEIIKYATDYCTIYMVFSLGMLLELTCIRILQATGNMKIPMISQLAGAVINIVFDPIFIFGYFGLPKMEVLGAAIATVMGQWVAAAILVITLLSPKQDVNIRMKGYVFKWEYVKSICKIGLPNFIMNAAMSFTNMAMNNLVGRYPDGVSVLNAQFKLQSFVFMPIFGLSQGCIPIMSYNYGSNDRKRFDKTLLYSLLGACAYLLIGFVLFQTIPDQLIKIFNPTQSMEQLGAQVFRIMSVTFLFIGINITLGNLLQSVNKPTPLLISSLTRQIVFVVAFGYLFESLWGLTAIFWCYPVAEFLNAVVFTPLTLRIVRTQFAQKTHIDLSRLEA